MAERRMLSRGIMAEDTMLSLTARAQLYYIHLVLHADDDGFVDRVRSLRKLLGVRAAEHQSLVDKGYLIPFSETLVVITHWHAHNRIRKDAYNRTRYTRELESLSRSKAGVYQLRNESVTEPSQNCHTGKEREDKDSLGKVSTGKVRKEELLREAGALGIPDSFFPFLEEWFADHDNHSPAAAHATLVQIKRNLDRHGQEAVGALIRLSIDSGWKGIFFQRLENKTAGRHYGSPEELYD